jgi:signal transduction histidine kinase
VLELQFLAAGEEASVVLLNKRSDGRKWYNALDISPIRGPDGEVTHYLGFQRDVTDLVSHEQRLTVLDRVLRHNIRNRLNVVLGYADRAERAIESTASTGDPLVIDADELRTDTDRIREAATDILDLSDSARRFREDVGADGADDPVDAATVVVDVASAFAGGSRGRDGVGVDAGRSRDGRRRRPAVAGGR